MGQRAADTIRNVMGSWKFVFIFMLIMAVWALYNLTTGAPFDPYPFILLNLALSTLAGLQGAILLIAAKRADEVSASLAQHDYETNVAAKDEIESLQRSIASLENEKHVEILDKLDDLMTRLPKSKFRKSKPKPKK